MENNEELNDVSVSLVDVKGSVNGGVVLLLSLMISDELYEIGYWFNKNDEIIISPEDRLLEYLGVTELKDYEYFDELLYFIHNSIPNKEEIIKEFIK